ncbi:MAG: FtsQ-type POTRA domain-containing protein [Actinomycetota bacterium]|nr:FtsQ-type POTRA domain-containing protein [Actinomycetota bacterium]
MHPGDEGRRLRRSAIVALAVVALGAGSYASTFTAIFGARTIRVEGQHRIGTEQVQRLAGLETGVNVFHLDTAAAEHNLEADPRVLVASVSTDLPSTVVVTITERLPVAVVTEGAGSSDLIGADGVVIGPATGNEQLPAIVAADGASLDPDALRSSAAAAGAMDLILRRQVRSMVVQGGGSLELELRSGVTASLGEPTEILQKGQALEGVLRWAVTQSGTLASVDVSVPSAPTATLVGGAVLTP